MAPPPPPPAAEGTPPPPPVTEPQSSAPATPPIDPGPTGPVDPHGFGAAIERLGFLTKRSARLPALIAATELADGERVELIVQGTWLGRTAVGVLTDRRLVVANDREWKPDIRSVETGPGLVVQGWGDERSASLHLSGAGEPVGIADIGDAGLARELAQALRARAGV